MIRYEILSNVASSERGLQRHPELQDLADTLRVQQIDARAIRHSYRAEAEINLASSRHARGVTVRGTAVQELRPETHIRGCLAWLRAVNQQPDRALHFELDNVRATNGAALILPYLYSARRKVFVSGADGDDWTRLTAPVDLTGQRIAQSIERKRKLKEDYLARAGRAHSFFSTVQRIVPLRVAEPPLQTVLAEIAAGRDPDAVSRLSPSQVVNVGLMHEALERYAKLVQQFHALLLSEASAGELPTMFDMLTRGIGFGALKTALLPYVLEDKRRRVENKRMLANELRIGLQHLPEADTEGFLPALQGLILRRRLLDDPRVYDHAVRLEPQPPALVEALHDARERYLAWQVVCAAHPVPDRPQEAAPTAVAEGMFELGVTFVFQARFQEQFPDGRQPPAVVVARNLMSCFIFERFDLARLRNLHPKLPPKGVARNLAEKVRPTQAEISQTRAHLWNALYPMGRTAVELSRSLQAHRHDREAEREARQAEIFLRGAPVLLRASHYVLGTAGQSPMLRQAALASGGTLGLGMLESPEQMHTREAIDPRDDDGLRVERYLLLMQRPEERFFPLGAPPRQVAGSFKVLFDGWVVHLVRRAVAGKLQYLVAQHGGNLFDVLYDRVAWRHQLRLSRDQLATILLEHHLFDKPRLKEFGYTPAGGERNRAMENPWLAAARAGEAETAAAFEPGQVEAACRQALAALREIEKRHGATESNGRPDVAQALAGLAREGVYDLLLPRSRAALAETREATLLADVLSQALPDRQAPADDEGEAPTFVLPGSLAYLTLLGEWQEVPAGEETLRVRLLPGRYLEPGQLDASSQALATRLSVLLDGAGPYPTLRKALERLQQHNVAWRQLVQAAAPALLDRLLQATALRLVAPRPPLPGDLAGLPEERILCLSTSSGDQSKFHRIVAHPERRDVYATLSELAAWLHRFTRLREELEDYRNIVADLLELIAGLNLSPYDAPHLNRYVTALKELDRLLDVRPEEIDREDLTRLEASAAGIGVLVRESFEAERTLMLRDRWMSRLAMRLRTMRPNLRLTFVDRLHERHGVPPDDEDAAGKVQEPEYQTFSERVRNVVGIRERLEAKQVFVLSPNNTQGRLTLTLVDQLYRLKGVNAQIFADVSGCPAFVDLLRSRLPPHRLFDLNAL